MTGALWVLVAILGAIVVFQVFALNGATRTVADLTRRLDALTGEPEHPAGGLPVGSVAPLIEGAARAGQRHLVVFADPGCAACETLIPPLLASDGLPPVVLVGRSASGWPDGWRSSATVVFDPKEQIADAYRVGFTPQVFVVDEGGSVVGQGPADSLEMLERIVRDAEGLQVLDVEPRRA